MKALELENYGVSELAYLEQEETDGGGYGLIGHQLVLALQFF